MIYGRQACGNGIIKLIQQVEYIKLYGYILSSHGKSSTRVEYTIGSIALSSITRTKVYVIIIEFVSFRLYLFGYFWTIIPWVFMNIASVLSHRMSVLIHLN